MDIKRELFGVSNTRTNCVKKGGVLAASKRLNIWLDKANVKSHERSETHISTTPNPSDHNVWIILCHSTNHNTTMPLIEVILSAVTRIPQSQGCLSTFNPFFKLQPQSNVAGTIFSSGNGTLNELESACKAEEGRNAKPRL
jgi:hypothetical protein